MKQQQFHTGRGVERRGVGKTVSKTMASATFVEVLLAIFLPPVGVFLRYGCGVSPQDNFVICPYLIFSI
jgi:hypothetical protein